VINQFIHFEDLDDLVLVEAVDSLKSKLSQSIQDTTRAPYAMLFMMVNFPEEAAVAIWRSIELLIFALNDYKSTLLKMKSKKHLIGYSPFAVTHALLQPLSSVGSEFFVRTYQPPCQNFDLPSSCPSSDLCWRPDQDL
jgi:hypothetical protein